MEIRAEDGWRPYVGSSRPRREGRKAMVEFVRAEWLEPFRSTWDDLPAATNIIGLYWRPVDPTREVAGDGSDSRPKPEKHRIVHAWHFETGYLFVLGSDGRILWRDTRSDWHEIAAYPPGLEP